MLMLMMVIVWFNWYINLLHVCMMMFMNMMRHMD